MSLHWSGMSWFPLHFLDHFRVALTFFSWGAFQQRAAPSWHSEVSPPPPFPRFEHDLKTHFHGGGVISACLNEAVDCAGRVVRSTYWTPPFKALHSLEIMGFKKMQCRGGVSHFPGPEFSRKYASAAIKEVDTSSLTSDLCYVDQRCFALAAPANGGDWNGIKPIMKVARLPARARDKTSFTSSALSATRDLQTHLCCRRPRPNKADRTRDRHLEAFIDLLENVAWKQWRKTGKRSSKKKKKLCCSILKCCESVCSGWFLRSSVNVAGHSHSWPHVDAPPRFAAALPHMCSQPLKGFLCCFSGY